MVEIYTAKQLDAHYIVEKDEERFMVPAVPHFGGWEKRSRYEDAGWELTPLPPESRDSVIATLGIPVPLREHPLLKRGGHPVEWPPVSGWVSTSGLPPRDPQVIGTAALMEATYQPPTDASNSSPALRLRIKTATEEYRMALVLDDHEFLRRLHYELPRWIGMSLEDVGNVEVSSYGDIEEDV